MGLACEKWSQRRVSSVGLMSFAQLPSVRGGVGCLGERASLVGGIKNEKILW